ncbi:MAG TPA: hypothetical protein G4O12_02810 [Dehalococcoidia bacterium]|nr:hypothetical protein [Dehalococcoidia bacterium]
MLEGKELLTEAEAQRIAERFLSVKYFQSKVDFSNNQLIIKDDVQIYQLQGKISMQSRGSLNHFIAGKSANKYSFKIEVDAQQGQVLSYELT